MPKGDAVKVRTFVGAQAAYACITTDNVSLDVRLYPGKSAAESLREWATDQQVTASRLTRQAALAREAASILEN